MYLILRLKTVSQQILQIPTGFWPRSASTATTTATTWLRPVPPFQILDNFTAIENCSWQTVAELESILNSNSKEAIVDCDRCPSSTLTDIFGPSWQLPRTPTNQTEA